VLRGGKRAQKVTSNGGNKKTALAFDQRSAGDACKTVKKEHATGTAIAQRRARKAFTLLGLPVVKATIKTKGNNGFIAARLWDVFSGKQRLVSRGVYRLKNKQKGKISFQLFGNGYDVKRGHTVKIELVGRDPNYLRTSNSKFSVSVKKLSVTLPTRQKHPR
jgi:predicted acyl esterase